MRKSNGIAFSIIALIGIWFFFRPELVFVSTSLDEDFPMESAEPLFLGHFYGVAHETEGVAMVHRFSNGRRLLRLTHFETSNGPDVHVILVAASDASDSASVREVGYVSLGPMKATRGNQNYELPPELDLARYGAVTIWCQRFSVNFGTAPLIAYGRAELGTPNTR